MSPTELLRGSGIRFAEAKLAECFRFDPDNGVDLVFLQAKIGDCSIMPIEKDMAELIIGHVRLHDGVGNDAGIDQLPRFRFDAQLLAKLSHAVLRRLPASRWPADVISSILG